jgi:hypothetical protein
MTMTLTTHFADRDLEELVSEEEQEEEEFCGGDDHLSTDPWGALRQRVRRAHYFMTNGFA